MGARFGVAVVGACLVAAASIAASAAAAEPPAPMSLRFGDITFSYNPQAWRIAPRGDGAIATCIVPDCSGVVFDISQRPTDGSCSEDSVREASERLFPQADRHAVNTVAAGRFALVLAESRRGPELDVATYVFGCVDWQGRDYRFMTRPETVGDKAWSGGHLHALLSQASAPPARIETLKIGDMTLDIATDVWRVAVPEPGRLAWLTCRAPTCRDGGQIVTVSAQPGAEPLPDSLATEAGRPYVDVETGEVAGQRPNSLAFRVETAHSGCRNYVPPQVVATARHGGTTYRIASPAWNGCRSAREIPRSALDALLRSARVVSSASP